tara:strand:+ start:596032 stop:596994 length:963 start_codon:yes stop_codon:yes gene_type:complete
MPHLKDSTYSPSILFKNGHLNTIYRVGFGASEANYVRKRVELKDGDFIDLDFSTVTSKKIVVITHGLEGSSNSTYVISLTEILNNNGYDTVAINLRGCSGEPNRLLSSYHSGKTEDLDEVIQYIQSNYSYSEINLVGYSLGGNLTLKYIGEAERKHIHCAVAISVPCDLKSTALKMNTFSNRMYLKRFLKTLKKKAYQKVEQFPDSFLTKETIANLKNFKDFDDFYTAPAHHFKDAEDYWLKASCQQFIPSIKTNSLLINALDDPFLTKDSFPIKEATNNAYFHLETPKYGGHVGFVSYLNITKLRWCENRILSFLEKGH